MPLYKFLLGVFLLLFTSCTEMHDENETLIHPDYRDRLITEFKKYDSIMQVRLELLVEDSIAIEKAKIRLAQESLTDSIRREMLVLLDKVQHDKQDKKRELDSAYGSVALQCAKLLGGTSIAALGFKTVRYINGTDKGKLAADFIKNGVPKKIAYRQASLAYDILKKPKFKGGVLAFTAGGIILAGEEYYELKTEKRINPWLKYGTVIIALVVLWFLFSGLYKKFD